jgi:exopolyphosphatase/guanosine-5'-triphosphate,3'-diphosphate pyrophosphatase
VAAQLGREPFVPFEVVARCGTGHPMVIRNHPVDDSGKHFPTLYWLTCPDWSKAVARLESAGWVKRLEQQVETDPNLRTRLRRAHEEYAKERGTVVPGAQNWGGVGGSRQGVKCLHAHYAYTVAGGSDPIGNWVHRTLLQGQPIHYERPTNRIAAIDLGTNSIRLLVTKAHRDEGLIGELARDMVITRIGEGVDSSGRIEPAALQRTIQVMRRYVRRARALGAERIHLAATSAVRDAKNRDELAQAVLGYTGEPMEVLSGAEEARTTFLGATRGLRLGGADAGAPYLVMDIGGGSTEFVLGRDGPQAWISTQMGSVRLTERFAKSDPPSPEELARIEEEVDDFLAEAERAVPVRSARTLIAVAGTSTTVQAISKGMIEYDPTEIHGSVLSARDAERVAGMLADMTTRERRAIPVMPPGREDVIPAGATILVRAMRRWGFEQATLSESDILDGLALRMIEDGLPDRREVELPARPWVARRVLGR